MRRNRTVGVGARDIRPDLQINLSFLNSQVFHLHLSYKSGIHRVDKSMLLKGLSTKPFIG